jgi:nitroreductase
MLDVVKKRRSIRRFLDKEIEKEKIEEVLRAAMTAPSAHNGRPWQFWVIRDKEIKEKLSRIQPWADFVARAPVVLAIGAHGGEQWIEDCALVASLVYLDATNQGLGTCLVQVRGMEAEGGEESEMVVREIISAPKNIRILCLMPLGYPQGKIPEHSGEIEKEKVSMV